MSMDPALTALLRTERGLWRGRDQYYTRKTLPTGYAALDCKLPAGGWSIGTLTELLVEQHGIGELSLLLPLLASITTDKHWGALINPPYTPYAPALACAGVDLDYLLIVNTGNCADTFWSAEQLLRNGSFHAVISWINASGNSRHIKQLRRLQLAAEQSNAIAVIYQDSHLSAQHSPAALRIRLRPATNSKTRFEERIDGLTLDVIKARGGTETRLMIPATAFDKLQGIEWPVVR